jgi:hypothetical protein
MALRKPQLRWQPLSHFLQHTHGPLKSSSPQLILVHLPAAIALQAFDLLCWTINMAARPHDTIVALRQGNALSPSGGIWTGICLQNMAFLSLSKEPPIDGNLGETVSCPDASPQNSGRSLDIDALFQPLRSLCDMKEVTT